MGLTITLLLPNDLRYNVLPMYLRHIYIYTFYYTYIINKSGTSTWFDGSRQAVRLSKKDWCIVAMRNYETSFPYIYGRVKVRELPKLELTVQ